MPGLRLIWMLTLMMPLAGADEAALRCLPLAGPATARSAEFSGLAWHGDVLLMLPQFPKGALMALDKQAVLESLSATGPPPLTPRTIPFDDAGLPALIPGFAGYEALSVSGEQVYLAIETESLDCTMGAWLVAGRIDPASSAITLDSETRVAVPLSAQRCNMAVEALTVLGDAVYALEEANGARVTTAPQAHVFDRWLHPRGTVPMPALEYRVTDATACDSEGVFWVTNYLWPGDLHKLDPAPAPQDLPPADGTNAALPQRERLVALRIQGGSVVRAAVAPIWLAVDPAAGRNWEGVVRLEDRGFLVVTDEHPSTLFGFVAAAMR